MIEIDLVFKSGATRKFVTDFNSGETPQMDAENLIDAFGEMKFLACRTHPDGGWMYVRPDDVSFISVRPVSDDGQAAKA